MNPKALVAIFIVLAVALGAYLLYTGQGEALKGQLDAADIGAVEVMEDSSQGSPR